MTVMLIARWCLLLTTFVHATSTTDYDENLAFRSTIYSSIAYVPAKDISSWSFTNDSCYTNTEGFTLEGVFTNLGHQSQGFLGLDNKTENVVMAFRGTTDVINDLEDLQSVFRFTDECVVEGVSLGNVHTGFCGYYQSLASQGMIDKAYSLMKAHNYKMLVTGHSLGAAVASLAATHMGLKYPGTNPVVYTVGEPRAGDSGFVALYNKSGAKGFRVIHASDPIPHAPLACDHYSSDPGCPLHQASEVYYRNEDMPLGGATYVTCDIGEDESKACSDSMPWTHISVHDHMWYFNWDVGGSCHHAS